MLQLSKSLVLAAAGVGLFSVAGDVSACPRGGGGGGGGGGYRAVYRPAYAPQQCQQPYYPQQFQRPSVQPFVQQQQFPQQQFAQQQQPVFPQQQVPGGAVGGQDSNIVLQVGNGSGGQGGIPQGASASALSALGGAGGVGGASGQIAQQGIGQQNIQQPQGIQQQGIQQQPGGQPAGNGGLAGNAGQAPLAQAPVAQAAPVQGAPAQQAPGQGNPAQAAPAQQNQQQAIDMALAALGGEQPAAAAEQSASVPQAAAPTGEFTATIANGTQIRLSLRADGSFVWLTNKAGKASNFQGTFRIDGGSLVLLRGSDNQKLEGSFTPTESGFQLRLAGQTDNALAFVRG